MRRVTKSARVAESAGSEIPRPWDESPICRRLVADHPDGLTLDDIAIHLGVSRQRAWQIYAAACRKLVQGHGEWGRDMVRRMMMRRDVTTDELADDVGGLSERFCTDVTRAYHRIVPRSGRHD